MRKSNPHKRVRTALARVTDYKERAKILRAYKPDTFSADSGYDLRQSGDWSPQKKAAVTRAYNNIEKLVDEKERHEIEIYELKKRAKRLRPFFRDTFNPDKGFDLRNVKDWTTFRKKKLTEYYKVMAPNLAADNVVAKRYRRKDHLETAIIRSGQEELLKGQTAAAFGLDKGETLDIQFTRKGDILLDRDGVSELKLDFNMVELAKDPLAEIERVLNLTKSNVFKIQTGPTAKSYDVFTRASIGDGILARMSEYSKVKPRGRFDSQHYSKWLFGLYAYPDATVRQQQKVSSEHRKVMAEKKKQEDKERRKKERKWSVKEVKVGRALSSAEKTSGRKGRIR